MTETNRNESALSPGVYAVLAFTVLYMVLATGGALSRGNSEFLIYIGVMIVLVGVVAAVHLRVHLTLPVLWCLSIWGLLHMMGGLVPVPESWPINGDIRVLYSLWLIPERLKYDQVVHAFGFGVTTWVCWQGLRAAFASHGALEPTFGLLVLCAAGGMGFGAMNEVVEFTAVLLVPETNVGGYMNTGWDLVANLTGTVVAAALIRTGVIGPR
jgi:uncharacterized membrane protein YjdF